jgi:ApaG protein
MNTAVTEGVAVSVETEFQPDYSSPLQYHYVFTYKVRIENRSNNTVQLLRRHWYITDAMNRLKEVEGEGVVGQQPVLEPGDVHEYTSGCNLKSGFGKMHGTYLMQRLLDEQTFEVEIPEFSLIFPFRNN